MSLIRQFWLLLWCTLLVALGASWAIFVGSNRATLEHGLSSANRADAEAIAQGLEAQPDDPSLVARLIDGRLATGRYRRIALLAADGRPATVREAPPVDRGTPDWFAALAPIEPAGGLAPVARGLQSVGTVEVFGHTDSAQAVLWHGSRQVAAGLALLGLVGGGLAGIGVRRIGRRLGATVAQAEAIERGDYTHLPEPRTPELRHLTRAMNSMVARLRHVFEAQAAQVEALRRQASGDPLTGLSNRGHFIAQLGAALTRQDATGAGGMVLLRVLKLVEMNRSLGRAEVDRLLLAIAQTLQAYASQVGGAFAGRLNGADFALVLPESGMAVESAEALINLLKAELPIFHPSGAVVAGAVECQLGGRVGELLADADMALARAESEGPFRVMSAGSAGNEAWAGLGERGWHERVRQAIESDRVQLGRYPVVDASGGLVHLECPLRLRLTANGPYETAANWLPFATRSRLNGAIDERGLALALAACTQDGLPRCIQLSAASLLDTGFALRLCGRLRASPAAARLIWLEVVEPADDESFESMRELARQIRATGARFGIDHAGGTAGRIERLFDAGLDYVKLDAAITRGVADHPDRAGFAESLVGMLHGMSLRVFGKGVVDGADAARLHGLGIDGLTGPWVSAQQAMAADTPARGTPDG